LLVCLAVQSRHAAQTSWRTCCCRTDAAAPELSLPTLLLLLGLRVVRLQASLRTASQLLLLLLQVALSLSESVAALQVWGLHSRQW
jgi:hypothetical protein